MTYTFFPGSKVKMVIISGTVFKITLSFEKNVIQRLLYCILDVICILMNTNIYTPYFQTLISLKTQYSLDIFFLPKLLVMKKEFRE